MTERLSGLAPIEAFLRAAYGGNIRLGGGDDAFLQHQRLGSGPLVLDLVASTGFAVDAPPLDALIFSHMRAGVMEAEDGTGRNRAGPGQTLLIAGVGLGTRIARLGDPVVTRTIAVESALVADVAANRPDDVPRRLAFTAHLPATAAAGGQWVRLLDFLEHGVLAGDTPPLLIAGARRLVAATALAVFPNTADELAAPFDRSDAGGAALHRAIAYVETNLDRDLGIRQIAAAARVTTRAVQLAFRRHLGMTPTQYVRRLRLDQAHRELQAAVPGDGTSVAGIGRRWGFASASRFASHYRAAYGVSPRATLRRGV